MVNQEAIRLAKQYSHLRVPDWNNLCRATEVNTVGSLLLGIHAQEIRSIATKYRVKLAPQIANPYSITDRLTFAVGREPPMTETALFKQGSGKPAWTIIDGSLAGLIIRPIRGEVPKAERFWYDTEMRKCDYPYAYSVKSNGECVDQSLPISDDFNKWLWNNLHAWFDSLVTMGGNTSDALGYLLEQTGQPKRMLNTIISGNIFSPRLNP